jgi:hypothetical protein
MKTELGKDKMLTLVGKGVSPRLAKGEAFVHIDMLQRGSELYRIRPAEAGDGLPSWPLRGWTRHRIAKNHGQAAT